MTPDDKRHGTYAGADAHRRAGETPCPACLEARRRYFRRRDKLRKLGHADPRHVPIGERNLAMLREAHERVGNYNTLGQQIGVAGSTVFQWLKLKPDDTISSASHRKLAEWSPRYGATHVGCLRRLQALIWNGYTVAHLATRIGATEEALRDALRDGSGRGTTTRWAVFQDRVRDGIVATYNDLWDKPVYEVGERSTLSARKRAHHRAITNGWAPAMAWDDIDDVNEKPATGSNHRRQDDIDEAVVWRVLNGEHLPTTRAEKDEIVRRWVAKGGSEKAICERLGLKAGRYGKAAA